MKRRYFIQNLLVGLGTVMAPPLVFSKKKNSIKKSDYTLPSNPELYTSVVSLSVSKNELPKKISSVHKINNQENELILKKSGDYSFQYLGPYYGWRQV